MSDYYIFDSYLIPEKFEVNILPEINIDKLKTGIKEGEHIVYSAMRLSEIQNSVKDIQEIHIKNLIRAIREGGNTLEPISGLKDTQHDIVLFFCIVQNSPSDLPINIVSDELGVQPDSNIINFADFLKKFKENTQIYADNINDKNSKMCEVCKKIFSPSQKNSKYCSETCRDIVWRIYMTRNMKKKRLIIAMKKGKISVEVFDTKMAEIEREEKGIIKWTPEMCKRMRFLIENQQICNEPLIKENCWVCGSKENLVEHHVKYYPKVIKKILCRSCHEWLHKVALNRKKCRPKNP